MIYVSNKRFRTTYFTDKTTAFFFLHVKINCLEQVTLPHSPAMWVITIRTSTRYLSALHLLVCVHLPQIQHSISRVNTKQEITTCPSLNHNLSRQHEIFKCSLHKKPVSLPKILLKLDPVKMTIAYTAKKYICSMLLFHNTSFLKIIAAPLRLKMY